jgi:hypothetical protein
VTFVSNYAPIEFSFPQGWYVNTDENPYDLQCFSQAQDMNTGVFVYRKLDLVAADSTPLDTYWDVINDLGTKRTNFEEFEKLEKHETEDKTVTTVTYKGEREGESYCYRFSLIEFREDDSKFAVLLQVALPEEWNNSKPVLEAITLSAKSIAEVPDADGATGDATGGAKGGADAETEDSPEPATGAGENS